MDKKEKISRLMSDYNFENLETANAWVETRGRCPFCPEDLLDSQSGYWSGQIEQLLPKSKYPSLEHEPLNCVLSCVRCNPKKATFDPLDQMKALDLGTSRPLQLLREKRDQLIEITRSHLKQLRADDERIYNEVKAPLRDP